MNGLDVVILAAGEGKRMRSRQPKILHRLCGRPLIAYPLRIARSLGDHIVVVAPPNTDEVARVVGGDIRVVVQRERLGTGHAMLQAQEACQGATVLVLPGDMPLLRSETIGRLVSHHASTGAVATLLTAVVDNPQGYGRVLRQRGRPTRIVEERDATDDQKKITEIGTSVYCFDARRLWAALAEVRADNDQGEYYLTDVIGIFARAGAPMEAVSVPNAADALGVNDRRQLAMAAAIQRRRILDTLMESGVTIVDPASTYIEDTVSIGPDTLVYPQVVIEGETEVGSECVLESGCQISASRLGDRVRLRPYCVLREAVVEDEAELGPFCHLRPQAHIGQGAKIGNFVEVKKSRIGRGAKANHLAYIGDATVGDRANIGAGAVTCNYDGYRKSETVIGPGAFVGTNTSLVAPVTIGEGAYVGSGSVITRDVPPGALALERTQQTVKEGWVERRQRERGAKPKKGE